MKLRLFALTVSLLLLFTACSAQSMKETAERVEDAVEAPIDAAEDKLEAAVDPTPDAEAVIPDEAPAPEAAASGETPAAESSTEAVTQEKAESIALEHAGLLADEVRNIRTEYEIDDGIPHFEVQFYYENWEYDYEIHAETGEILSFDKDD